ncbi:oligopeptide ABC transporter permease [Williamsoniiplasma somnilux]|uniref:Oligopeptide ABC transporter permease n=1 Tax=Williamsoniiplasma somnilux TaxID=215578 RepID=A0A2K8NYJ8_9MOLU|nr:oligopeptide ABC transporter permease OppC [Williamsoniiplasma somnilux]ATZ18890.1 oligopeptide ABC transporter permease [Williamsoniiplasma somnilux]
MKIEKDIDRDRFKKINKVKFDEIDKSLFTVVGIKNNDSEHLASKPYSYWKTVGKLLITNWTFIICVSLLLIFIALAIFVPIGKEAVPSNPTDRPSNTVANPSWEYVFGLGVQGEDFWIEIWAGMRTTLLFALLLTVIQISIGILFGSIWGYFRKTDILFIQLTNFLQLVPQLILLLLVIFLLGNAYWPIIFGISLQAWISMASTIRVQIMLVKNTDYNTASISLGSKPNKIIRKNIMPKILPVIVQTGAFAIPNAISIDSSLSFLGFAFTDGKSTTSLGKVLNNVMVGSAWQDHPHLIIIPIVLITTVSIVFFLVAKVFADSLDPKNHR